MGKIKDLTGQRFEKLTVLERDMSRIGNMTYWICKCDCGNIKSIRRDKLLSTGKDKTFSCGCHRKETGRIDEIGNRYGCLEVISLDNTNTKPNLKWICKCDCGSYTSVLGKDLRRTDGKAPRSCGCLQSSIGEDNIAKILTDNKIQFIREYNFKELGRMRYDFAIIENNEIIRLIEFDGIQHYDPRSRYYNEDIVKRDKIKNEFAISKGIPLIRITYDKRDSMTLEDLM